MEKNRENSHSKAVEWYWMSQVNPNETWYQTHKRLKESALTCLIKIKYTKQHIYECMMDFHSIGWDSRSESLHMTHQLPQSRAFNGAMATVAHSLLTTGLDYSPVITKSLQSYVAHLNPGSPNKIDLEWDSQPPCHPSLSLSSYTDKSLDTKTDRGTERPREGETHPYACTCIHTHTHQVADKADSPTDNTHTAHLHPQPLLYSKVLGGCSQLKGHSSKLHLAY
jgi:hypothetical protein